MRRSRRPLAGGDPLDPPVAGAPPPRLRGALGFGASVLLGAFLLFLVQPLIGKVILPWFGGISAVWITCLLFFQVVLLGGYAYAHVVATRLGRAGPWVHLVLLGVSLLLLPIGPDPGAWKPVPGDPPVRAILLLLTVDLGLPYLLLAATGPLIQSWFSRSNPGRSPYRLYALSNAASLLALLAFPLLVETTLASSSQLLLWSAAYAGFALACGWCAVGVLRLPPGEGAAGEAPHAEGVAVERPVRPSAGRILWWLALAACGSALLLSVTNQLCQEVAVVPFLWVLPLAVYLVTFILCFDHERWYDRRVFGPLLGIVAAAVCYVLYRPLGFDFRLQLVVYLAALFVACMVCHGELVRSKPAPRHLTLFYLAVAAGGALGGVGVALVAPLLFRGYWELHVALFCTCALALGCWVITSCRRDRQLLWLWLPLVTALVALGLVLARDVESRGERAIHSSRTFYGALRVVERTHPQHGTSRRLMHGMTRHGQQFTAVERRGWPTSYYAEKSGIGLALTHHPRREAGPLRVGVVGLGVGTLASYGRAGDVVRFYEINPDVVRVARQYFTYLADSRADVDVVLGDARLRMEEEAAGAEGELYDILAIDAFNSDSIPMHLMTVEATRLYWSLLAPDGLLLFHVSNHHLDLKRVVRGLAESTEATVALMRSMGERSRGCTSSTWMVLARDGEEFFAVPEVQRGRDERSTEGPSVVWTDDFASLWPVFDFD